jgi:hypothetical protein
MGRVAARLYVPLDVGFFDDEKVVAAGEKAAFLYLAMCAKAKLLDTDGILTRGQIAKTALPGWQARLKALLEQQAVIEVPMQRDAYLIAAWHKWNESKETRGDRLAEDRARKRAKSRNTQPPADAIPTGIQ